MACGKIHENPSFVDDFPSKTPFKMYVGFSIAMFDGHPNELSVTPTKNGRHQYDSYAELKSFKKCVPNESRNQAEGHQMF